MNNFDPSPLSDAAIEAGARPGESWKEAQARLSAGRVPQSALSEREWRRFVHLVDDLQTVCIERLRESQGLGARLLLTQVQCLFEYCCALSERRPVVVVSNERLRYGLFDEAYAMLSRLGPGEADGLPECFIGLLDVLSHPHPYQYLLSLEADGTLKKVLGG